MFNNTLLYLEYRVLYPLIALFPTRLAYKMATLKGVISGLLCKNTLNSCIAGVNQCFSAQTNQHNRTIAKAQLRMLAREELDVYLLPRINKNSVKDFITLTGLEHYLEAKKTGKPVILYTGHYGRLIMPAIALGIMGYKTSPLMAPVNEETLYGRWYVNKKINAMSIILQGTFVNTTQSMRMLYSVLSKGETLIVIVDVPPVPKQAYYEADFLEGKAVFPKGIVKLARKMDALLVPYFALEQQGKLEGVFLPAIATEGLIEKDILARILQPLEEYIIRQPEQWWMWPWLDAFWMRGNENA